MELNENGMPKCVISTEYSYSTLKSMTKNKLIDLLDIAQHNYECVNEYLTNLRQYAEKLDKALDEACLLLERSVLNKNHYTDEHGLLYVETERFKTAEEWRECLMKGDEKADYEKKNTINM